MGAILIVFGVLLAGAVANFVVENSVATAEHFTMFGVGFDLSTPALTAIAFGLGLLTVLLIVVGIRTIQHGRHRTLEQRFEALKYENSQLAAQRNLETVVRIPEAADLPAEPDEEVATPVIEAELVVEDKAEEKVAIKPKKKKKKAKSKTKEPATPV